MIIKFQIKWIAFRLLSQRLYEGITSEHMIVEGKGGKWLQIVQRSVFKLNKTFLNTSEAEFSSKPETPLISRIK